VIQIRLRGSNIVLAQKGNQPEIPFFTCSCHQTFPIDRISSLPNQILETESIGLVISLWPFGFLFIVITMVRIATALL
jgi:hypothetical protein